MRPAKEMIQMKIMIVEDDKMIGRSIEKELERWDYSIYMEKDFDHVLDSFVREKPDLVLLDIRLPYYNGYYWCEKIREISRVPILFISSQSDSMDKVMAIQMGADDYLTKPIDLAYLVAKVQAALRRAYDYQMPLKTKTYAGVEYIREKGKLLFKGKEASLTQTELQILDSLFERPGDLVRREKIIDRAWEESNFIDDNTLAVNMSRLRKKLREIGLQNFISTKKGLGYALEGENHEEIP